MFDLCFSSVELPNTRGSQIAPLINLPQVAVKRYVQKEGVNVPINRYEYKYSLWLPQMGYLQTVRLYKIVKYTFMVKAFKRANNKPVLSKAEDGAKMSPR